jgi:hypothetical protein
MYIIIYIIQCILDLTYWFIDLHKYIFFDAQRGESIPTWIFIKGLVESQNALPDSFINKTMEAQRGVQHQGTTHHSRTKHKQSMSHPVNHRRLLISTTIENSRTKHKQSMSHPVNHCRLLISTTIENILADFFMTLAPCTTPHSYTTPLLPSIWGLTTGMKTKGGKRYASQDSPEMTTSLWS